MSTKKPLTEYFEERYKEEFSELIESNLPEESESIMPLIYQAYKEGFSDGASLGLWSKESRLLV